MRIAESAAGQQREHRAAEGAKHHHRGTEQDRPDHLERVRPVRPHEVSAAEDLFDHLGVDRNARHALSQWRGPGVEQADRRGADENDVTVDQRPSGRRPEGSVRTRRADT